MAGGRRIAAAACAGALALALAPRGARASTCDTTYATLEACNAGVASGTNCTWDAEASKCGAGAPIEDGGFSVTTIGDAECVALGETYRGVMLEPACAAEYSALQPGASVTAVVCQSGCIRRMLEATQAMIDAGCGGDYDLDMPPIEALIETLCGDDGASSDAPRGAQGAALAALAALAAAALAAGTTYPPGL